MLIKAKKIIGSKVVSKSGCYLGKVIDFEIDASGQNIVKYYTTGGFFDLPRTIFPEEMVRGLLKGRLIINASQVIEIKKDKIIVEDAAIPEKITKKKTSPGIEYAK